MGHLSVTKLHNVQKLQDRAIALIQSAPIKEKILSAMLGVEELIKYDQAVMVCKILNEQCPEILRSRVCRVLYRIMESSYKNTIDSPSARVNSVTLLRMCTKLNPFT